MIPTQNPHNTIPPDYGADRFAPAWQPLVASFGISHEEAAQQLLEIWTANRNEFLDSEKKLIGSGSRKKKQHVKKKEKRIATNSYPSTTSK
ncbi:hypothetical protein PAXRUDRAFT_21963 [Paxillus rubicundulus Ve08.2h10]|uniref:Uncharacterized protein n=1 Tax=Paxillus rubicundulus Ve08.2h10 TaxID=930991 RepID=A0A0D0CA91_9AGAM|nr:hypothetical protein PAXRUDRAFT_21963 [Paxillus rubicundulus Ve08.2h10]